MTGHSWSRIEGWRSTRLLSWQTILENSALVRKKSDVDNTPGLSSHDMWYWEAHHASALDLFDLPRLIATRMWLLLLTTLCR